LVRSTSTTGNAERAHIGRFGVQASPDFDRQHRHFAPALKRGCLSCIKKIAVDALAPDPWYRPAITCCWGPSSTTCAVGVVCASTLDSGGKRSPTRATPNATMVRRIEWRYLLFDIDHILSSPPQLRRCSLTEPQQAERLSMPDGLRQATARPVARSRL
jgi:hypothetical protein